MLYRHHLSNGSVVENGLTGPEWIDALGRSGSSLTVLRTETADAAHPPPPPRQIATLFDPETGASFSTTFDIGHPIPSLTDPGVRSNAIPLNPEAVSVQTATKRRGLVVLGLLALGAWWMWGGSSNA